MRSHAISCASDLFPGIHKFISIKSNVLKLHRAQKVYSVNKGLFLGVLSSPWHRSYSLKWIGLDKIIMDSPHFFPPARPPAPIPISEKGGAEVHCTVASCRLWTLLDYNSSSKHKAMASIVMSRIWIMAPGSINPYSTNYITTKSILQWFLNA